MRKKKLLVGLDFGTSNSSIALFQNDKLRLFEIDQRNINPKVLPSYIYITKEHEIMLGARAIENYLEQETGRPAVWERRKIGEGEIIVSGGKNPIIYIQDFHIDVDIAAQGRLLQSIKTALRNPSYEGTLVFNKFYTIEELISLPLVNLRQQCEQVIGEPVTGVVIGRPVKFSDIPETDQRAEVKLHEAAELAGFEEIHFEYEPVGGAYLYHKQTSNREKILVFDFGGGTLDMTIMEVGGRKKPKSIATQGVLIGGDDMDSVLMKTLFYKFGDGAKLRGGYPFPAHIFEKLLNWQNLVELSRPVYYELFQDGLKGSDPEGIQRLKTLVDRKLGFNLFRELENVKISLSDRYFTWLEFADANLALREMITRKRFEDLISEDLQMVEQALDDLMIKSGLQTDQISAVVRTGGSSSIPAFMDLLSDRFGLERLKATNLFTTIVGGLAIKAQELANSNN